MTTRKIPYVKILLLVVFSFLLNSIAIAKGLVQDPEYLETHSHSGFLGNYDDFKVMNPQTEAKVWLRPPYEDLSLLKDYKAIVFSPIEVWMDPKSGYRGIDPNELKLITDYFLQSLVKNLSPTFSIVEESGPGVMNIRIAITGISKSKPDYKKMYNLIPVKLVWELSNAAYRKATSQTIDVYEAQVELEVRDSESGVRLVAAIDKHQVKDQRKKDEDTDSWKPVEEILDYWSEIIAARLNAARKN